MKKIISVGLVLMLLLFVGCGYLKPDLEEGEEDGITYVDISDLIDEDIEEEEVEMEEEVEEVSVKETLAMKITEGDLVSFPNLKAKDPDGDKISYEFSSPLDDNGEWQTEEGDAGEYKVVITASDGESEVSKNVNVIVMELNKAPVLEKISDITVKEGQTVKLSPKALDPEGETLTITYSGWMDSNSKKLDYNSAGEYIVRVTVSDGSKETHQDVQITVKDINRAPEFVSII
jgi:hypothetical protein